MWKNKLTVSSIPYEIFECNIIRSEKILRYKTHSNDVTPLKFNVRPIIKETPKYINSTGFSEKVSNLLSEKSVQYGISVYDFFIRKEAGKSGCDMIKNFFLHIRVKFFNRGMAGVFVQKSVCCI